MQESSKTLLCKKISELTETSVSSLDKIFQTATRKQFKKGDFILKQGQICKTIYFVEKGHLRTYFEKDGKGINTHFTFEGNFTTNLKSLYSSTSAEVTIEAGEPMIIYEFDKDKLLELYKVSPEIESFGRNLLIQLLIAQEEHSKLFKIYSPTEHYRYLQKGHPEVLQRISLSQLASYLGIARETLSRIRKNKV